jgi:glutamine synthetase type III
LFAQWVSPDTKQFSSPAIIKESTAKNGPRIYNYAYTGNKIYALVKTTVEHAILLTSVYSPSAPLKTIIGYSASEVASTFNGNSTQTASITTAIPTMTRLDIGDVYATNDRYSNHHIARLTYYPTRLPDATLQALTL